MVGLTVGLMVVVSGWGLGAMLPSRQFFSSSLVLMELSVYLLYDFIKQSCRMLSAVIYFSLMLAAASLDWPDMYARLLDCS